MSEPSNAPQASRVQQALDLLWSLRRHPRYSAHLIAKKLLFHQRYQWIKRNPLADNAAPFPLAFRLMLTWKCGLRCPMCMLRGDHGWRDGATTDEQEMPWAVVERILDEGRGRPLSLVLSGGEPLMYSRLGELLSRLRSERRFATICTNGLLLRRFAGQLDHNPYVTPLVSLDGLRDEHDAVRGPGVFEKVVGHIRALKALARPPYIGVQFTIQQHNVATMEAFCERMVGLGVDWILLNPTWFITAEQGAHYQRVMEENFGVTPCSHKGYQRPFEPDRQRFIQQLSRIRARRWPIQISCYLKDPAWIHTFLDRPEVCPGNDRCTKQYLRMDVLPDGKVTPCGQFPDLMVGDLTRQSVAEVWNSAAYAHFRGVVRRDGLPVCSKCDSVYLYDPGRSYL